MDNTYKTQQNYNIQKIKEKTHDTRYPEKNTQSQKKNCLRPPLLGLAQLEMHGKIVAPEIQKDLPKCCA